MAPNSAPYAIVAGPDGAMWFTEEGAGAVGRIDARGNVRRYPLPESNPQPEGIASGDDGALYVADNTGPTAYATHIARIETNGTVREWNDLDYMPQGVAMGPDGGMWFTQSCGGLSVLKGGRLTQIPLPGYPGQSSAIVEAPDGSMWFSEDGTVSLGRVDPAGSVTLHRGLYFKRKYNDIANGVAVGSDGNLWWTALERGAIWSTNARGDVVHVYAIPTRNALPWGIAAGPDGALWFTEYGSGKIGRVTTDGAFTEFAIPTPNAKPQGLAFDRKGNLWFAEHGANRIGRLTP